MLARWRFASEPPYSCQGAYMVRQDQTGYETPMIYDAPAILETFAALEVMGTAEGFEVYSIGNGSNVIVISVAL